MPADTSLADASLADLFARLEHLEARVREAVARRRSTDPDPDDRFRGLYLSNPKVDELLAHESGDPFFVGAEPPVDGEEPIEGAAPPTAPAGAWFAPCEDDLRLDRLRASFGLDDVDLELLLVAVAPDLDPRFERLYGYLHDDITRRRATIGLALELARLPIWSAADRRRLSAPGRLVAGGLVGVEDGGNAFLARSLRVPDRVTAHLLGDDTPDPSIAGLLATPPKADLPGVGPVVRALRSGSRQIYMRDRIGAAGVATAAEAFTSLGRPVVCLDLGRIASPEEAASVAAAATREARLTGAGIVASPIEAIVERSPSLVRPFMDGGAPVVLVGHRPWDPAWTPSVPLQLDAPMPSVAQRSAYWEAALGNDGSEELIRSTLSFRLSPDQVYRAVEAARLHARAAGREVGAEDVRTGARSQNSASLDRLSRRVEPRVTWGDLVLPVDVLDQLRELAGRARHRERVIDDWGVGGRASRGRGITALFAGESGTGKTISAEVVANEFGLDLYVIDLSTVVDKYIGETEKNLDRIFGEADRVNGVLLFDEADAIFGEALRGPDARDRYANVEVAYLLQRMETFDGLAVLTTNLRANLDDAFTRRIDAIVDFPMPEEERPAAPLADAPAEHAAVGSRPRPGVHGRPVPALGRQHPQHLSRGRLPRRRAGPAGDHGRPHPGNRARVSEARAPDGGGRVRSVPAGAGRAPVTAPLPKAADQTADLESARGDTAETAPARRPATAGSHLRSGFIGARLGRSIPRTCCACSSAAGNGAVGSIVQRAPDVPGSATAPAASSPYPRPSAWRTDAEAPMELTGALPAVIGSMPSLMGNIGNVLERYGEKLQERYGGHNVTTAKGETISEASVTSGVLIARDAVYHFSANGSLVAVESNFAKDPDPNTPDELPPPKHRLPDTGRVLRVRTAHEANVARLRPVRIKAAAGRRRRPRRAGPSESTRRPGHADRDGGRRTGRGRLRARPPGC